MAILLDELPTEIIHNIVVYAIGTSPRTGILLKRTNRCFYEAVKVVRNRRRTFKLGSRWEVRHSDSGDGSNFETINHLTIEDSPQRTGGLSESVDLIRLITKIKNLKTLTWSGCPISVDILNALSTHHASCDLRIFEWWFSNRVIDHLSNSEIALARFRNLTHFRARRKALDSSRFGNANTWQTFQQIVAASPRLVFASYLGRIWDHEQGVSPKLSTEQKMSRSLKTLAIDCPGFTLSLSRLQEIGGFVDLSNLEALRFTRGFPTIDYFQNAATLLPKLKHISLNFSSSTDQALLTGAGQYLRTCSPVQTLSLWAWTSVITIAELVERHGSTLEVLQLHEREDDFYASDRKVMDLSDIKLLRSSCRRLVDLTLDLNSENGRYDLASELENKEFLSVLTDGRPRLAKIQLYLTSHELHKSLSIGMCDDDSPVLERSYSLDPEGDELRYIEHRKPGIVSMVEPYATAIWKLLHGQDTTGDRQLDIKFGNWESRVSFRSALEEPRAFCEVKPQERDDRMGDYVVKTKLWSAYRPGGV